MNNEEIINEILDENVKSEKTVENQTEENTQDTVTFEDLGLDEYTLKAVEKKDLLLHLQFRFWQFHDYLQAIQILLPKHVQVQEKQPHSDFQLSRIYVKKAVMFRL